MKNGNNHTYGQKEVIFRIFHTLQGDNGKRDYKVKRCLFMNMPSKHEATCVGISNPSSDHTWSGIFPSLHKRGRYCKQDHDKGNQWSDLQLPKT